MLAFLGGAAVGVVAALLLAPQSGEESRDQIRRYARKTGENLRDLAGKAEDTWGTAVEKGRQFVQEQKSTLADAMEAGRQAMRRERDQQTEERTS
jgi:gas vesicle protein